MEQTLTKTLNCKITANAGDEICKDLKKIWINLSKTIHKNKIFLTMLHMTDSLFSGKSFVAV